jgi:hypothetical protein
MQEDEVSWFSSGKCHIVEVSSLAFDLRQYFSDVLWNHEHDNRVAPPGRRATRVFRKHDGSDHRT